MTESAMNYEQYVVSDPDVEGRIRQALMRTYFRDKPAGYFASERGAKDLRDHVSGRYTNFLRYVVPWVAGRIHLEACSVVEVGCGTGSATAAFARFVQHIDAYDVNERSVEAARERLGLLGLKNVSFHVAPPQEVFALIEAGHRSGVHLVLMAALLEHLGIAARLAAIATAWKVLRPEGVLAVWDTPNRLAYFHGHTSDTPFFDMLPPELALRYASRCARREFAEAMRNALRESETAAIALWERWGRGASFHEFEIVLGDLRPLVVGDGYDPEITAWRPVVREDELLNTFFAWKGLLVPRGFSRRSLEILLRKPDGRQAQFTSLAPEPLAFPKPMARPGGPRKGVRHKLGRVLNRLWPGHRR